MEFIRTRRRFSPGRVLEAFVGCIIVHPFLTLFAACVFAISLGTVLRHTIDVHQDKYREAEAVVNEFPALRTDLRGYCADGKMTMSEFCELKSKAKGLRTERMIGGSE
jgi:hypothetical protein